MVPVCADYLRPVRLPLERHGPVLGFFPGASIGNVAPDEAQALLVRARETLGPSRFLVEADPTQDEDRLRGVYGDCCGLFPAVRPNLLTRLTREIDADAFRHEARVAHDPFRVEAHLVAVRATALRLGGREIAFAVGESLRTDTSHKYAPEDCRVVAARAGWTPERVWLDPEASFSLPLLLSS